VAPGWSQTWVIVVMVYPFAIVTPSVRKSGAEVELYNF